MNQRNNMTVGQQGLYKSIAADIVLTLFTFGLFNIWVQYRQIKAVNYILEIKKYSFLRWMFLTIITFGLYHIYHEWRMSVDLAKALGKDESLEGFISLILSAVALSIIADAIQQARINEFSGNERL